MDGPSGNANDVAYPDVHLNSPISLYQRDYINIVLDLPGQIEIDSVQHIRRVEGFLADRTHRIHRSAWCKYAKLTRSVLDLVRHNNDSRYNETSASYNNMDRIFRSRLAKDVGSTSFTRRNRLTAAVWRDAQAKLTKGLKGVLITDMPEHDDIHELTEGSEYTPTFSCWEDIRRTMRTLQKSANDGFVYKPTSVQSAGNPDTGCKDDPFTIFWYFVTPLFVVILIGDRLITLSKEQVLMITDVAESRVRLTSIPLVHPVENGRIVAAIRKALNHLDALFPLMGNKTYEVQKLTEALTQGLCISYDPGCPHKNGFLKFIIKSMIDAITGYIDNPAEWVQRLCLILDLGTPDTISEMMCLYRLLGHPHLSAIKAAEKVRTHMHASKILDNQIISQVYAMFCAIYITAYGKKHSNSWPCMVIDADKAPNLTGKKARKELISDDEALLYWREFAGIDWGKSQDVVLDEDLSMFMKDRAISPTMPYWDSVFNRSVMAYDPPYYPGSRRLVQTVLDSKDLDPERFLNYVTSGEYLTDPNYCMSYSLKEREVNTSGRIFGKMTEMMRGAQVLGESLLANGVAKYFEDNGMVKTETELLKSLYRMSGSSLGKTTEENGDQYVGMSAFLTTDICKYCLNQREEMLAPFASALDKIYGLHEFFNWHCKRQRVSLPYVADPYCPPLQDQHTPAPLEDDQLTIAYPAGCVEGYCQKMWTLVSIAAIRLAGAVQHVRIMSLVQGDNQVVAVCKRYPPAMDIAARKRDIYLCTQALGERLRLVLMGMGLELKPEETIVSTEMFVYSKRLYYSGRLLPQAFKAVSRICLMSETIMDDIRSACSTIFSSSHKALCQGLHPVIYWVVIYYLTIMEFATSLLCRVDKLIKEPTIALYTRDTETVLYATVIPSQLGGYQYGAHAKIYLRNTGDPLVNALADVKRLIEWKILTPQTLFRLAFQTPSNCTWLHLAQDPYSLNIPVTKSLSNRLKKITQLAILQGSQNRIISELFHEGFEQEDEDTATYLLNQKRVFPRLARAILDLLPTGERKTIAGLVETTKTVIKRAIEVGTLEDCDIIGLLSYEDTQLCQFHALIFLSTRSYSSAMTGSECSVTMAEKARHHSWGHLSRGRPLEGLETPDPIEFHVIHLVGPSGHNKSCPDDHFTWAWIPAGTPIRSSVESCRFVRIPYVGSETDEKTSLTLYRVPGLSRPARRAIRIAMLFTWIFGTDGFSWLSAMHLATTRANFTYPEMKSLTPIPSSVNNAHRLHERTTQVSFSSARNIVVGRNVMMSNDRLSGWAESLSEDTNVIYQNVMLHASAVLEDLMRGFTGKTKGCLQVHVHVRSGCCLRVMPAIACDPLGDWPKIHIPRTQSLLMYDPQPLQDMHVRIITEIVRSSADLDFSNWTSDELVTRGSRTLGYVLASKITQHLKGVVSQEELSGLTSVSSGFLSELKLCDFMAVLAGICAHLVRQALVFYLQVGTSGGCDMATILCSQVGAMNNASLRALGSILSHQKVTQKIRVTIGAGLVSDTTNVLGNRGVSFVKSIIKWGLLYFGTNIPGLLAMCPDLYVTDPEHLAESAESFRKQESRLLTIHARGTLAIVADGGTTLDRIKALDQMTNPLMQMHEPAILACSPFYIVKGAFTELRRNKYISSDVPAPNNLFRKPMMLNNIKGIGLAKDLHFTIPLYGGQLDDAPMEGIGLRTQRDNVHGGQFMTRQVGLGSTSCIKTVPILVDLKQDSKSAVLGIGEGSGALISAVAARVNPKHVYFNTLMTIKDVPDDRELQYIPFDLDHWSNDPAGGVGYTVIKGHTLASTDASLPGFPDLVTCHIGDDTLSVITCDLEDQDLGEDIVSVWANVSTICRRHLSPTGTLILKLFCNDRTPWSYCIDILGPLFTNGFVFTDFMQGDITDEVYLVLRGISNSPSNICDIGHIQGQIFSALGKRRNICATIREILIETTTRSIILTGWGLPLSGPHVLNKYGVTGLTLDEVERELSEKIRITRVVMAGIKGEKYTSANPLRTYGLHGNNKINALLRDLSTIVPVIAAIRLAKKLRSDVDIMMRNTPKINSMIGSLAVCRSIPACKGSEYDTWMLGHCLMWRLRRNPPTSPGCRHCITLNGDSMQNSAVIKDAYKMAGWFLLIK